MPSQLNTQTLQLSKEEVRYWKNEIKASQDFRQKEFVDRIKYKTLIEYYEGFQRSEFQPTIEQMAIINEIYPAFNSIISNTYYKNPTVVVKAKNELADNPILPIGTFMGQIGPNFNLSDLMKAALEYAIEHYDLKTEARLCLFDLLFAGFACLEVNQTTISDQKLGDMGEIGGLLEGLRSMASNIMKSQEETELDIAKTQSEAHKGSSFDETYISWWNPMDILFDYRAKVFKRSRYIGKQKDLTVAEFKHEFPNFKDRIPTQDLTKLQYSTHQSKENSNIVRITELQIKKTDGVYVLKTSENIDAALDYYKQPVITNGFTIKYQSLDTYGTLYPISRARMAKKPQDELNHYTTIQMEHADRSQKKVAVFMDGLKEEGKNAVESSDVYAIVQKKTPGAVFEGWPSGGVDPANKDLQVANTENINKISGTNELAKSGKSESKFATQDALKNQSFQSQTNSVEDALGDLIRQGLDCLKDIIMQFWDGDYYFKVTGMDGATFWYKPEMGKLADILLGDYLVSADITSARRPNLDEEKNKLDGLVNGLINPNMAMFLQSKGKTISISAVEEWIKAFGKNPQMILQDIQPQGPMGEQVTSPPAPSIPQPPPIQEEGNVISLPMRV